MKSISFILKNIKNLLPYFLLIAIYFFFVNIEVSKEKNNNLKDQEDRILPDDKSSFDKKNVRLSIPVIPYKE